MAGSKGEGRSVLYYGCMGCGAVVLLAVLAGAGLAGLAWMQVGSEQVEERDLARPVETVLLDEVPAEAVAGDDTATTVILPATAAGTVEIDVSKSGFELRPGDPGDGVHVQARFDTKSYALEKQETVAEDGTWIYRIAFRRTGGFLTAIKEMLGGTPPKVVFFLPPDAPIRLKMNVDSGGAQVDLGGLWLTDLAIEVSKGGFVIECGAPNRVPIEHMTLDGSMGGFVFSGVANLAPREIDVDSRMGGMVLDLSGEWTRDTSIHVANRMGGMQVVLPDRAEFRGLEGAKIKGSIGAPPPETPEIAIPVLSFALSGDLEDIEFSRE